MIPIAPWLEQWPVTYSRVYGDWTLRGPCGWARLEPETGRVRPYPPERDLRLPGLAEAMTRGRIVGYRWGRRAVVDTGDTFLKVARASKRPDIAARHRAMTGAVAGIEVPRVLADDPRGWVELSRVPGRSLHQLLLDAAGRAPDPALDAAVTRSSEVLLRLHDSEPAFAFKPVVLTEPAEWRAMISRPALPLDVATDAGLSLVRTPVIPPEVPVHTDMHDKNVFLNDAGHDGLIDLDGVALGRPELDVANLAAHLVLRAMQGGWGREQGARWALIALDAYDRTRSLDSALVEDVLRHTWMRLVCIYRFRLSSHPHLPALLGLVTAESPLEALERLAAGLRLPAEGVPA